MNERSDGQRNGYILVPQPLQITVPSGMPCIPVPESDWDYLKTKVGAIRTPGNVYVGVSISAFSVAISALIAGFGMPSELMIGGIPRNVACWLLAAMLVLAGGLCLNFAREQKKTLTNTTADVVAEMKRIEDRYRATVSSNEGQPLTDET
jgi:hypothetical protein